MTQYSEKSVQASLTRKDHETNRSRTYQILLDDLRDPIMSESDKTHRASVRFRLGEWQGRDYGDGATYALEIGGEIPCSEEAFWSGEAHKALAHHLLQQAHPHIQELNRTWLKIEEESE
jgi:hypothetical protein